MDETTILAACVRQNELVEQARLAESNGDMALHTKLVMEFWKLDGITKDYF